MTTAREIRLPVKIQADAGQATATLRNLQGSLGNLEKALGGHLRSQAAYLGGLASGYLSIDSLIGGIKKLYEYGVKVNDMARNFDANAIKAAAETSIAKLEHEMRVAQAVGPSAAATEMKKQEFFGREDLTLETYASRMELAYESAATFFAKTLDSTSKFLDNPSVGGMFDHFKHQIGLLRDYNDEVGFMGLDLARAYYNMGPEPIRRALGLFDAPQMGSPVSSTTLSGMAAITPTTGGPGQGVPLVFPPEALETLREIARNSRGKP